MTNRPAILPPYTTPDELAAHFNASPRCVADKVKEIGAYAKIGSRVVLFDHHVTRLLEAMEFHSNSTGAAKSGTTGALLPEGDFAALQVQRKKPLPKGSPRKQTQQSGAVILMDRERMWPWLKLQSHIERPTRPPAFWRR